MLRFFRPRNGMLATSRLPMRLEAMRRNGNLQNLQRVRFQRPGLRVKPLAISFLFMYVSYSLFSKLVLGPMEQVLDEDAQADLSGELMDEGEEGALFIPFPGTTKQLKPIPYRGSDPEWQEYIRFSQDQKQAKLVREELANWVRTVAEKHPLLASRCGKGMKLRRYWLDVDFPTHPPPEFERTGLEITDEFIAISTVPVDSSTVFRIRNVLWPSPVMKSFWSFTKVLVTDDLKSIAKFFGIQIGPPQTTLEQVLAKHAEFTRLPSPKRDSKDESSPLPPTLQSPQSIQSPGRTTIPIHPEEKRASEIKAATDTVQGHFSKAVMAFKSKLGQTWRPAKDYPPRGSILVTGFVEVDSPKAWLVFDVKAAWDPKTKSYYEKSTSLSLRRLQMKKQGPLGGT